MKRIIMLALSVMIIFTLGNTYAFAAEDVATVDVAAEDVTIEDVTVDDIVAEEKTETILVLNTAQDAEVNETDSTDFAFTPAADGKYMLIVKLGDPEANVKMQADFDYYKRGNDGSGIAYFAFGTVKEGKEVKFGITSDIETSINVVIKKASFANVSARLCKTSYVYSGTANKPAINDNYFPFMEKRDYTIEYVDNVKAGTAKTILKPVATDYFYGSKVLKFTIKKKSLTSVTLTKKIPRTYNTTYTGKYKKPGILVYYGKKKLVKGTDYKVSSITYSNNKNIGKARYTLKITGIGNYSGVKTLKGSFDIIPKKATFKTPVLSGSYATLKWTKVSNCTGYNLVITGNTKAGEFYFKEFEVKKDTVSKKLKLPKGQYWANLNTYKIVNGVRYSNTASVVQWQIK